MTYVSFLCLSLKKQKKTFSLFLDETRTFLEAEQLISVRVNGECATETVNSVSIAGRVKPKAIKIGIYSQARSQDLEKGGGGYFERVRSVQTTLTRIFIDFKSVSDGLSEN